MTSHSAQENQIPNDEIDLRDLCQTLWQAKGLILVFTLVTSVIAVIYALTVTPTYQAQAMVSLPTEADLAGYNTANDMLTLPQPAADPAKVATTPTTSPRDALDLAPDMAFGIFLSQLQSATLRQAFFEKVYLPAHPEATSAVAKAHLMSTLVHRLSIQASGTLDRSPATLTWQGSDPQKAATWLNSYIRMAQKATHDLLIRNLKAIAKIRTLQLDKKIEGLRVAAVAQRQHDLQRLEDALTIAKTVQIKKPLSSGNLVASFNGPATYLRGSDALQAEIDLLKSHSSNDPYVPQLPELRYTKHLFETMQIDPEPFSVATIDELAIPPAGPIRPHKKLVIVLGLLVGLMTGVFAALIRRKLIAN